MIYQSRKYPTIFFIKMITWILPNGQNFLTNGEKGFDRRVLLLDSFGKVGECISVFRDNYNLIGIGIEMGKCAEK